jgi:hypothetical protein
VSKEGLKAGVNWQRSLKQKGLKQRGVKQWLIVKGAAYGTYKNSCIFSSLAVGWAGPCGTATTKVHVSSRMNYK